MRGQLGLERGEDIQLGVERRALVHVLVVFARPEKRFSGNALQPCGADVAFRKDAVVLLSEVVPHHAHHLHLSEVAGRYGKVSG